MTKQDDITQPVLTDDKIEALAKKHIAPHADRLDEIMPHRVPYQQTEQFRRVKALIGDVLSKLRAPVADERAAFGRAELSFPLTIPRNRVYLAGPMTGYDDHNFPAFHAAAKRLREHGLEVVNPADHDLVSSMGWSDYMRWDLVKLAGCHSVYVLPGWEKSKGASLEVSIAQALGMSVFTVEGAALASAPVADGPERDYSRSRLRAVLAPDSALVKAHREAERRTSAPVAGEATPVAWKCYDAGLGKHMLTENPKVAALLRAESGNTVRPLVYGDAAPQASALAAEYTRGRGDGFDAGRIAALEEAAHLMEQTGKRIAASDIRALKPPQADKDGAQQRAGDAYEALNWYAEQVGGCRKFGPDGEAARHALDRDGGERASAALSATQPEQGERDAD